MLLASTTELEIALSSVNQDHFQGFLFFPGVTFTLFEKTHFSQGTASLPYIPWVNFADFISLSQRLFWTQYIPYVFLQLSSSKCTDDTSRYMSIVVKKSDFDILFHSIYAPFYFQLLSSLSWELRWLLHFFWLLPLFLAIWVSLVEYHFLTFPT